jgi:phosphatidylinositol glycan class O
MRFVADPPTVTMQRLKGLTTGGLPTFADITGSFGGASVDEDSWVEQLKDAPWERRRRRRRRGGAGVGGGGRAAGGDEGSSGGGRMRPMIAFVGDDTWVDLFPTQFDDSHPFPSFNTRDLDTVDDGCLHHLPRLLDGLVGMTPEEGEGERGGGDNATKTSFELIVAHFLGVDHVGHTYGPSDPHMERKLHQMDVVLSDVLGRIDDSPQDSCVIAFVLGDHGMTEDGNHGGGSSDEVNAGLFAHFSPGCGDGTAVGGSAARGEELGAHSARVFDTIHQIDLVPTISMLMGLPIPFANIGGLVPDLLPPLRVDRGRRRRSSSSSSSSSTPHIATALALNAAQVWNYLYTYSRTSRDLPADRMRELREMLDSASLVYRDAISQSQRHHSGEENGDAANDGGVDVFDSTAYRQACALFKLFLAESTEMGKQVWTQFNEGGMMVGIGVIMVAWIMAIPLWNGSVRNEFVRAIWVDDVTKSRRNDGEGITNGLNASTRHFVRVELATSIAFMTFHCGVLTFGNSYIEHEREIVAFFLSVICLLVYRRRYFATPVGAKSAIGSIHLPLIVALCSRTNDIFITGHGLDPSIHLHAAHHPAVFLSSLLVLAILRIRWLGSSSETIERSGTTRAFSSTSIDIIAIMCISCSWWDKRSLDHSRTGFVSARLALVAVFLGLVHSLLSLSKLWKSSSRHGQKDIIGECQVEQVQLVLFRAMLFLVIVTGPSMGSTGVFILIQSAALRQMIESTRANDVAAPAMAAIWRLAIRQVFFASNHHCSFNRLQFSAAFVATNTFQFFIAGFSLFMNTFGYEILGSCMVLAYSQSRRDSSRNNSAYVWEWFIYFQWTEILASCLSVSMMKLHLMVWAIFAPRFMFAVVFTAVGFPLWVLNLLVVNLDASPHAHTKLHQYKQQVS